MNHTYYLKGNLIKKYPAQIVAIVTSMGCLTARLGTGDF